MNSDRDQSEVLRALARAGYAVSSIADLRTSGLNYSSAIPVLLEQLAHVPTRSVTNEIVRALSVPWAKPLAVAPLVSLFRDVDDGLELGSRWIIGNALSVIWDDSHFDELAALAADKEFGRSREMIVLGLAKSKREEAKALLLRLANDGDVDGHAVQALRKLKVPEARETFERMLSDKRAWVRGNARAGLSALTHLDRSVEQGADRHVDVRDGGGCRDAPVAPSGITDNVAVRRSTRSGGDGEERIGVDR